LVVDDNTNNGGDGDEDEVVDRQKLPEGIKGAKIFEVRIVEKD